MKKMAWVSFIALRYISKGRKTSPAPVFAVLGIATGVLALIVIIAVMNGFQLSFIESILEISSAHIRLEGNIEEDEFYALAERLRSLPDIASVLPFREYNLLIRGRASNPRGVLVRAVNPDALTNDPGLAGKLEMESGYFDLYDPYSIVLGAELARHLFVSLGDEVHLLSIAGGIGGDGDPDTLYRVTGIFRSGFYEFDLGWAYVSMDAAEFLSLNPMPPVLGIKINNRWQDQRAMNLIRNLITEMNMDENVPVITSWRDYNRAFFGALRTEKLMMFILVGLIFIVVGVNIFQAQRRIVLERREEIGLLRALGGSSTAVRLVFVWDGFLLGLAGAALGLLLGLAIAFNIQEFFSFLENLVNSIISLISPGDFSIFSPQIFYIKEIPSRLIFHEVVIIFLFGFLSALLASWFASGKVLNLQPAEVLRYE